MAKKNKNKRVKLDDNSEGGFVFSTNSNFAFEGLNALLNQPDDGEVSGDVLEVHLEKKGRGGKTAVVVKGFTGSDSELTELAKKLKTGLGVGGSVKDGEIIIQGANRDKAMDLLNKWGHKTKRVGG